MPAKSLMRLAAQLTFGVDTLIGLGAYVLLSFLFQESANLRFLLAAGFFSYLPDFDLIYFLFQSKEVRKWGHWRLGFHHPVLFLPLVATVVWRISSLWLPAQTPYLTTLAVVCVFGHFVHDSTIVGLHWFSPFTKKGTVSFNPLEWTHILITRHGVRIVPRNEVEQVYADAARKSEKGGAGNEIEMRIEAVTRNQLAWFVTCIAGLITLALSVGYRLPF